MPRREHNLTAFERQKIANQILIKKVPIHLVMEAFSCSKRTVERAVWRFRNDMPLGDLPRSGRPRILSDLEVHAVIHDIKQNGFITLQEMKEKYDIQIKSKQTLINYLKKENVHCYKAKRKPNLTAEHKARRVQWAEKLKRDWSKEKLDRILYTDEKSFYNVRNSPVFYWREKGTETYHHYWVQDRTARFRVNCWGAITKDKTFRLIVVSNKQDGDDYFDLLEEGDYLNLELLTKINLIIP